MYCRGQERVGPCLYFQNAFRRLFINKFTFNFKPFDSVFPHYMRLWYWTSKHCTYIPIDKGLSRFVKIFFLYVKLVLFFASLFLCSCKTVVRCRYKHKASTVSYGLQLHSAVLTVWCSLLRSFLDLTGSLNGHRSNKPRWRWDKNNHVSCRKTSRVVV